MLIASCATQTNHSDRFVSQSKELSVEQKDELREIVKQQELIANDKEIRFLSLAHLTRGSDDERRFRIAGVCKKSGYLDMQILPTTSLVVLEQLSVQPSGVIEYREQGNASAAEKQQINATRLKQIFGDLITPMDLCPLLLGKVPNKSRYSDFFNMKTLAVRSDVSGSLQYVFSGLDLAFNEGNLSQLILRDTFQGKDILEISLKNYKQSGNDNFPQQVNINIVKHSIQLQLVQQQLKVTDQ